GRKGIHRTNMPAAAVGQRAFGLLFPTFSSADRGEGAGSVQGMLGPPIALSLCAYRSRSPVVLDHLVGGRHYVGASAVSSVHPDDVERVTGRHSGVGPAPIADA